MKDIRCPGKLAGRLVDYQGRAAWEIKCSSRVCGAGAGVVVLHRFCAVTGELLDTRRYRDPVVPKVREEVKQ